MSMSWFSVKTLLKTSLHLAFTGVLIIPNEIEKYATDVCGNLYKVTNQELKLEFK